MLRIAARNPEWIADDEVIHANHGFHLRKHLLSEEHLARSNRSVYLAQVTSDRKSAERDADLNACKVAYAHAEEVGLYLMRKYNLQTLDVTRLTSEMLADIESVFR